MKRNVLMLLAWLTLCLVPVGALVEKGPLIASPGYFRFVYVQGAPEPTLESTIQSNDSTPFEIVEIKAPDSLRVTQRKEGGAWKVQATLVSDAPVGTLNLDVVVRTNHPDQPEIRLHVSGFVRPAMFVSPKECSFGSHEGPFEVKQEFQVSCFLKGLPEIKASCDIPGLTLEVTPDRGSRYRLLLKGTLPKGTGEIHGNLTVVAGSHSIQVPIAGQVR